MSDNLVYLVTAERMTEGQENGFDVLGVKWEWADVQQLIADDHEENGAELRMTQLNQPEPYDYPDYWACAEIQGGGECRTLYQVTRWYKDE
jgi:hypothetical protein